MSNEWEGGSYHHATDRVDAKMIAACPNGCQSWEVDLGQAKRTLDELVPDEFRACAVCGAAMDTIAQETASEVLE